MAITVRIPSYLATFAGGRNALSVNGTPGTVRGLLGALWQLHPALKDRIVDEQGEVRQHINIFVDGEAIRHLQGMDTSVPPSAEVMIVPAVSGG